MLSYYIGEARGLVPFAAFGCMAAVIWAACARWPTPRLAIFTLWGGWLGALAAVTLMTDTWAESNEITECHMFPHWPDLTGSGDTTELANIALFVPGAFLAGLMLRWGRLPLAATVAAPFAIETMQYFVPELERACDVQDVISNTVGAALGLILALVALRLLPRPPRHSSTTPPARSRRTAPVS